MNDKTIRAAIWGCKYCNPNNGTDGAEILFEHRYNDLRIIMDTRGAVDVFVNAVLGRACLGRIEFSYCPMCGAPLSEEAKARALLLEEHNEPLTLDELRATKCNPKWIVPLGENTFEPRWCSGDANYPVKFCFTRSTYLRIDKYGENWIAYRRPPEVSP